MYLQFYTCVVYTIAVHLFKKYLTLFLSRKENISESSDLSGFVKCILGNILSPQTMPLVMQLPIICS